MPEEFAIELERLIKEHREIGTEGTVIHEALSQALDAQLDELGEEAENDNEDDEEDDDSA